MRARKKCIELLYESETNFHRDHLNYRWILR
jgi:hypothetical protein